ncbi:MAG: PP2C family protein-serine/threonine phosphatase [Marmoricola sp.]
MDMIADPPRDESVPVAPTAPAAAVTPLPAASPVAPAGGGRTHRRTDLVQQVGAELAGSLSVRRVVLRLLSLMAPATEDAFADWMAIGVLDASIGTVTLYGGLDHQAARLATLDRQHHGALVDLIGSDVTETIHVGADPRLPDALDTVVPQRDLADEVRRMRPAEILVCPLSARGTGVGFLLLARGSGGGFPGEDVTVAREVAGRFAMALDSARLYEDRARVASVIERSLRPAALPQLPYLDLASSFRPAAEHLQVGGDFYDAHAHQDGCVVVLGDVCGKGIEAAVLTGQARQTIRTAALFDKRPTTLLATLNEVLCEDGSERFVTAVCVAVHPEPDGSLSLEVATAGHPAPLVVRADGTVEELVVQGRLAGVTPGIGYESTAARLEPGDLMLLFSDGIYEARGSADLYGMDRLVRLISKYPGVLPSVLCEAIEREVVEHLGGQAHDDITMVALAARS